MPGKCFIIPSTNQVMTWFCDSKKKQTNLTQTMIEWLLESQPDVAYWKYALVNDSDMPLLGYQNHPENNLSNSSC